MRIRCLTLREKTGVRELPAPLDRPILNGLHSRDHPTRLVRVESQLMTTSILNSQGKEFPAESFLIQVLVHLFCGDVVHCLLVAPTTKWSERKVSRCHVVKRHLMYMVRRVCTMLFLGEKRHWYQPQYSRGQQSPQMFCPQVSSAQPSRTYLGRFF